MMLLLSGLVMFGAAVTCVKAIYVFHILSENELVVSGCQVIYKTVGRVLSGIVFISVAYFLAEFRWILMLLHERTPEVDEVIWILIEGGGFLIMYLTCDLLAFVCTSTCCRWPFSIENKSRL